MLLLLLLMMVLVLVLLMVLMMLPTVGDTIVDSSHRLPRSNFSPNKALLSSMWRMTT